MNIREVMYRHDDTRLKITVKGKIAFPGLKPVATISLMDIRFAYITCKDSSEAKKIGHALIEDNLVACINIIHPVISIYRWQGKIEEAQEAVLIAKTVEENVDRLADRVNRLSSYDCPCIATFVPADLNPQYRQWLEDRLS